MRFQKWLDQLRQRIHSNGQPVSLPRRKAQPASQLPSEVLEERAVLSVSTLFVGGELSILIDGADSVVIRPNPADTTPTNGAPLQVLENGIASSTVSTVQVQNIQSIRIRGGGGANLIDLSAIEADTFTSLVSIRIDGGDGADTILGSADLNDTIFGSDGDDSIVGGSGNNSINAGDGNDVIEANEGADTVDAGDGNDLLTAGDGADSISGGDGDDTISGEAGNDTINSGDGEDLVNGNAGDDSINGDFGFDTLNGDAGNDFLIGGEGADLASGGNDNDTIYGLSGVDTISGDDGDDQLHGGTRNDILSGGAGNDFLEAGVGHDNVDAGDGNDTVFGGGGDDTIVGGNGTDTIYGNGGNDSLQGSDGQDFLSGGDGDDVILATDDTTTTTPTGPLARLFALAIDQTNSIVELDPATGNELRRFPAPETISSGGDGLAFDGTRLFFLNGFGTDMIYEIDPDTGTVLDQDPVTIGSRNYEGLAVLGGQLYFLDVSAGDIHVFDTATDSVIRTIDVNGLNPQASLLQGGLAGISNPDQLVVVEAGGNRIHFVNPLTGRIASSFSPGTTSAGAYFGAGVVNGEVYLGASNSGTIDVFSRTGLLQRSVALPYPVSALGADDIGTATVPTGGGTTGSFDIELTFDASITPAQQLIFRAAADRWERIIVGDLPDVIVPGVGMVDDISIDISTISIDTVGNILGSTQLIAARAGTFLPSAAEIQFDTLDLPALENSGQLQVVALHEMAHALGFGTIWDDLGLISGATGLDPQFRGANAVAEYNARFGTSGLGVPVENVGGPGSADAHWRETVLTNELMTSVLDPAANPLTRLTVAQFQDLGYQVDYSQADGINFSNFSSIDLQTNGRVRGPYGFVGTYIPAGTTGGATDEEIVANFNAQQAGSGQLVSGRTRVGTLEPMIVFPGLDASKAVVPTYGPTSRDLSALSSLNQINARLQIPEIEGNDTLFTPMNLDASFSQEFDPNIGDVTLNTSTTIPHVSLQGTGDNTFDFYSFTVTNSGDRGIFDIDFTSGGSGTTFDSVVVVYNSQGQILASNDDANSASDGQGGSTNRNDAFLDLVFTNPGVYTVGVGRFGGGSSQGIVIPTGAIYTLQVSIQNHQVAGSGGTSAAANLGDTILGDNGNDTIFGSEQDDNLTGGFGNDVINGNGGADQIYGGAGNDSLNGGDGSDTIRGHNGDDTIDNGAGDDFMLWRLGDGNDLILDADGLDVLDFNGTAANDVFTIGQNVGFLEVSLRGQKVSVASGSTVVNVNGLAGDDFFNVGNLDTVLGITLNLVGGLGQDTFNAAGASFGSVRVTFDGGDGGDAINGSNSDETIVGGSGNDIINGGAGNDLIRGLAGNDTLTGGTGDDTLEGGMGLDVLDGGLGDDSLNGGTNNDSLIGAEGNDILNGEEGNDTLLGNEGGDSLFGVAGNDFLDGGAGADLLNGGTENDSMRGGTGDDSILGGDGEDTIDGGADQDVIDAGDGNDSVLGGGSNDTLDGGDGQDTIFAGSGNDLVIGGDGHDLLLGQEDDDTLLGGDGDDVVRGNTGRDVLQGGEGFNTFAPGDVIDEAFRLSADVKALLAGLGKSV